MALTARSLRHIPRLSDLPVLLAAFIIGGPVVAALLASVTGGGELWAHIVETRLFTYTMGTLVTLALTAVLILLAAIPTAWLVTMYSFPGRGAFEWLLILPLAAPGYVIAYSYADLLGIAGPIQSFIRDTSGLTARGYWFPDIRSLPGLSFVLACALYPYVYLTARAAFTSQSICALEAARSLGASPARAFRSVALPGARPAIVAGLTLALMETAADYGAADFLGVQTLNVGLVRTWSSFGDVGAAARLALILVAIIMLIIVIERIQRGGRGSQQSSTKWRKLARTPLKGAAALGASALCFAVFALGFGLPIGRLFWMTAEQGETIAPIGEALRNTVLLAGGGAGLAFILAVIIALASRSGRVWSVFARMTALSGYAVPGAVLALGGIVLLSLFSVKLSGLAAILALFWVYASRFTTVGAEPMQAALARAPVSLGYAAQSLGAGPVQKALRVDLPVAMSGAAAGALILFVEALKELPATLMLRPFNWDTLAVRAHAYATDERLAAAAFPALLITLAGLAPVLLLSWQMARGRPGDTADG